MIMRSVLTLSDIILCVFMSSVLILNVIMFCGLMLNVSMLSVVKTSVTAPIRLSKVL